MRLKQLTRLQILGLFLAFLAIAGLFYWAFVAGYLPGIFPFALAYITVAGVLMVLLYLVLGFLWPILLVTLVICGTLARYTRRRIYRRVCLGMAMLPCLAVALLPAWVYFEPGPSLVVEPWERQYRVVFVGPTIDPDYGDFAVFQCDRTGYFCRRIHSFYGHSTETDDLKLTYHPQRDRFTIGYGSLETFRYVRSRQEELCPEEETRDWPACTLDSQS
ncbi:MAG: hypothetical protein SWY16_17865 [Cyanobacteriota bacterium]|nr:hypothetical protein [Cyanobacteriota bacterium]